MIQSKHAVSMEILSESDGKNLRILSGTDCIDLLEAKILIIDPNGTGPNAVLSEARYIIHNNL